VHLLVGLDLVSRPGTDLICNVLGTEDYRQFPVPYTIREMVENPDWGGSGVYTFTVGVRGLDGLCDGSCQTAQKSFTIWKLVSETVATVPANRDRTTIGIGEEVVVSTDPEMEMTWDLDGEGSVNPYQGLYTTFTAPKSHTTSRVIGTINGGSSCDIQFDMILPNGFYAEPEWLNPNPGCGTPGPPDICLLYTSPSPRD